MGAAAGSGPEATMATVDDDRSEAEPADLPGPRYTEYRGVGFWCRDGLLEVWLATVVDELDRMQRAKPLPPWLRRLRDDWRAQATIVYDGVVTCRLDDHVVDEHRRAELSELCRHIGELIHSADRQIAGTLTRRVAGTRWTRADTSARLERITGAFLWVLDPQQQAPG